MKKCDDTIEDDDESENEIARPSFSSFFVFFAPFGLFLWGSFLAAKTKKHFFSGFEEYIFGRQKRRKKRKKRKKKKAREGEPSQKFVVITYVTYIDFLVKIL